MTTDHELLSVIERIKRCDKLGFRISSVDLLLVLGRLESLLDDEQAVASMPDCDALYDNLAAADNGDIPLEEYPNRILKVIKKLGYRKPEKQTVKTPIRTGRCEHKKQAGGCPLHNLHCGYPKCDEYPPLKPTGEL